MQHEGAMTVSSQHEASGVEPGDQMSTFCEFEYFPFSCEGSSHSPKICRISQLAALNCFSVNVRFRCKKQH